MRPAVRCCEIPRWLLDEPLPPNPHSGDSWWLGLTAKKWGPQPRLRRSYLPYNPQSSIFPQRSPHPHPAMPQLTKVITVPILPSLKGSGDHDQCPASASQRLPGAYWGTQVEHPEKSTLFVSTFPLPTPPLANPSNFLNRL
jgi:hypothetical protein